MLRRHDVLRQQLVLGTLLLASAAVLAETPIEAGLAQAGQSLYRSGVGTDGFPLSAIVQQDVPLSGADAACANCHRRSGLGSAEGTVRALPVTAPALFAPGIAGRRSSAYDDVTLLRALTSGVAADGRRLSELMPRYRLETQHARALTAYLHELGNTPAPGVDDDSIDIATVVAATAPPEQQRAVEAVIERFVAIKNGGSRSETRRAAAANRHAYGERRDRAFRKWRLRFWRLKGPPADWDAQLERYYREQPPFALLSGATGAHWALRSFCERRQLPCILPLSSATERERSDFYTLYFADAARRDASVTAAHLQRMLQPGERILLVTSEASAGAAARRSFEEHWAASGRTPARTLLVNDNEAAASRVRAELAAFAPAALVAWLPPDGLQALRLEGLPPGRTPRAIYTAESFSPLHQRVGYAQRTYHVYPYRPPQPGVPQFAREDGWLRTQGLSALDPLAAAQALFACHVLGEALAGIESNFSRDYLMEELEHMLDGTQMTSIYPAVALGPGQRVLTHGAYVLGLAGRGAIIDAQWIEAPR